MDTATADAPPTQNELYEFAEYYIEQGFSVVPLWGIREDKCACPMGADCSSPGKHPHRVTPKGKNQAANDLAQIKDWIERGWNGNLGVLPGIGRVVFDVDGDDGVVEMRELQLRLGYFPRTRTQKSGGNGWHSIFVLPPEAPPLGNSKGKLGTNHVDVRGGEAGYIVAAPSLHLSGRRYEWVNPEATIMELPEAYVEALKPPPAPPPDEAALFSGDGVGTAYGLKALANALETIADAGEGSRNHTVNAQAFKIGRLIGGGQLEEESVTEALVQAAESCGLPGYEAQQTVQGAVSRGIAMPRKPEPREGRK